MKTGVPPPLPTSEGPNSLPQDEKGLERAQDRAGLSRRGVGFSEEGPPWNTHDSLQLSRPGVWAAALDQRPGFLAHSLRERPWAASPPASLGAALPPQSHFPPRLPAPAEPTGEGRPVGSGLFGRRAPGPAPPRQLPGSGCHRAEQLSACAGGSPGLRRRHFCCPDTEREAERVGDAICFHPSRRPCRSRCRYG